MSAAVVHVVTASHVTPAKVVPSFVELACTNTFLDR
jgi:hypothetical protein